jgi:membrane protein implicated in regulation of membrane protease activity
MDIQRLLIVLGAILLAAGLLWPWLGHLGLGRLPGDIAVERPHFRLYFPWVTCLLISVVLTLLIWLFRK